MKIIFLWCIPLPVREDDNLTVIFQPIVQTMCNLPMLQRYRSPWPVMGIGLHFLYVDDVCISQEIYLRVSTACYGDSLTFSYEDDVRTSHDAHL
jgi:hypothetical protein